MKRAFCLLLGVVLVCAAAGGCNKQTGDGTYEIDELKFLPLFSSASPDYYLGCNKGVVFSIGDTTFAADISKASAPYVKDVSYEDVSYEEEALDGKIYGMGEKLGEIDVSGFGKAACYKVMDGGEDTGYRIYYLDDETWIGHFSWFGTKRNAWWADYIFSVKAK